MNEVDIFNKSGIDLLIEVEGTLKEPDRNWAEWTIGKKLKTSASSEVVDALTSLKNEKCKTYSSDHRYALFTVTIWKPIIGKQKELFRRGALLPGHEWTISADGMPENYTVVENFPNIIFIPIIVILSIIVVILLSLK